MGVDAASGSTTTAPAAAAEVPGPIWLRHAAMIEGRALPPLPPRKHFRFDVTGGCNDRRPAQQLPAGFDHAFVEVFERLAHFGLAWEPVQAALQFGVLDTEHDCR